MKSKVSFLLFWVVFLFCQVALATNQSYAVASSGGGNNASGSGIQPDLFNGAGTYSLELPVPKGINGFQPKLILNYNSSRNNPNSWVGYGWELHMGYIERAKETTGSIDYDDGTRYQVHYPKQSETIVRVDQDINAADFGLSYSSDHIVDRYQSLVEANHSVYLHIRYNDTADSDYSGYKEEGWIVFDRSGVKYTFGFVERSRIYGTKNYESGQYSYMTDRWMMDAIVDQNLNEININYSIRGVIDTIEYQDIEIEFDSTYISKNYYPVYRQFYISDDLAATRLDSITLSSNGSRLQKYEFEYDIDAYNNFQYLETLTHYGQTDATSLEPTTFEYYRLDPNEFYWDSTSIDYQASRTSPTGQYNYGFPHTNSQIIDMNGDGLPDQVVSYNNSQNIYVYYNDGTGFQDRGAESIWADPIATDLCNLNLKYCGKLTEVDDSNYQIVYLLDLNGDTLPDRFYTTAASNGVEHQRDFIIAFNNGSGFDSPVRWRDPMIADMWGDKIHKVGFLDMNGDGLVDRVEGTDVEDQFRIYYNYGAGFLADPVYWDDAIYSYEYEHHHALTEIIDTDDSGNVTASIRDINGDGLPDRNWASNCYSGDTFVGGCLSSQFNINGQEFYFPELTATGSVLINGTQNIAIIDPVDDSNYYGKGSEQYGWADINGDGLIDRVVGDPSSYEFEVHFFNGLTYGADYVYLGNSVTLTDPVSNGSGDFNQAGYFTKTDTYYLSGWENKTTNHTFFMDMTGDGYPDRVAVSPANGSENNKVFKVYPMRVNAIEFSDSNGQLINQPIGALKSVDNGHGAKMILEYLPSTYNPRAPDNYHRFLPFNVNTVHKVYVRDTSVEGSDGTLEGDRYPGYRYTTYDFSGGNFYVRHAQKTNPSDLDDENLTTEHLVQFNGFQKVEVTSSPGLNETWDEVVQTTIFHQALGDVHDVNASEEHYFEAAAYVNLSISGQVYKQTKSISEQEIESMQNTWVATELDSTLGIYQPYLEETIITRTELGGANSQVKRLVYEYGDYNNVLTKITYDGSGHEIVRNVNTYFSPSDFQSHLQIKNAFRSKTTQLGSTVHSKTEYEYDANGNLTFEHRFSDATHFETLEKSYNSTGLLLSKTSPTGKVTSYTYDANNIYVETESVILPTGDVYTNTYQYDRVSSQPLYQTSPSGVGSQIVYDDFGRPLESYVVSSSGQATLDQSFEYDYFEYTVDGYAGIALLRQKVWQPQSGYSDTAVSASPQSIVYYNSMGQALQSCQYTERGDYRLIKMRVENGGKTILETDPVFDADCDFESEIGETEVVTITTKDEFNRVVEVDYPTGDSDSPIDDYEVTYSIDSNEATIKTLTTASGLSTVETYDTYNQLIQKIDSSGEVLQFEHDVTGRRLRTIHDGVILTESSYDWLGHKLTTSDVDLGDWSYEYYASGQLQRQIDNMQQVTEYTYDSVDRIKTKTIYNVSGAVEAQYVYNYDQGDSDHNVVLGELYSVEEYDGGGARIRVSKNGYDADYRMIHKITRSLTEGDFTQTLQKDYRGQMLSADYIGASQIHYQYNRVGGLKKVCDTEDCSSEVYYSLDESSGFNEFGQILSESFGNGVQSQYDYFESSKRLKSFSVSKSGTSYSQRNFTYDARSNIASIVDPLSSASSSSYSEITYDILDRLKSYTAAATSATTTLSYSTNGNLLTNPDNYGSNTYQYDSNNKPHAVRQIGTEVFDYDDNGNMIQDGSRTMTYNSQNQLETVTMSGGTVVNMQYDYTGSRVSREVVTSTGSATTRYLGSPIEIRDGGVVVLKIYAGSKKVVSRTIGVLTDLLGTTTGTSYNEFFYYHHGDHLGSSHITTEGQTSAIHSGITYNKGDLLQRFEYDPFGKETYILNPGLDLDVSFTGQEYDVSTGLYYYKARYYNPVLSRFIQPDTIVPDPDDLQSYNRYTYVSNNPLKYTDPTGHFQIGFGMGGMQAPDFVDTGSFGMPISYNLGGVFNIFSSIVTASTNLPNYENGKCPEMAICFSMTDIAVKKPVINKPDSTSLPQSSDYIIYYRSYQWMLDWVPGQHFWDSARNDWANGYYGRAALNTYAMSAEIVLTVSTLGVGSQAVKSTTPIWRSTVTRVFWSGSESAKTAAADFAKEKGGKTLEMTFLGRNLEKYQGYLPASLRRPTWKALSKRFAKPVRGTARTFHAKDGIGVEPIWKYEYEILIKNNVEIIYINVPK